MKWINLKFNRCPKCDKNLQFEKEIRCKCGFSISPEKMQKVILNWKSYDYDKTPAHILCSQCGRDFLGQEWMNETKKEVLCPTCLRDKDFDLF